MTLQGIHLRLLQGGHWAIAVIVGIWIGQEIPVHARSLTQDYLHVSFTASVLSGAEQKLNLYLAKTYKRYRLQKPRQDSVLHRTAKVLAHQLSQSSARHLFQQRVQSALWLSGGSDRQIQVYAMSFLQLPRLKDAFQKELLQKIMGQRPSHVGLAIAGSRPRIFVALFSRRAVKTGLVQRWGTPGQVLGFDFRLQKGFRFPKVILGLPGGKVKSLYPRPLGKRTYRVSWQYGEVGGHHWQIMASGVRGSKVYAEWKTWVLRPKFKRKPQIKLILQRYHQQVRQGSVAFKTSQLSTSVAIQRLLVLVAKLRKKHRLKLFRKERRLQKMAQAHATDMVRENFFGHTSPQRGGFSERFGKLRWKVQEAKENIVVARTPAEALHLLMRSPVHRQNLLSRQLTHIGIGAKRSKQGMFYFVQVFAKP